MKTFMNTFGLTTIVAGALSAVLDYDTKQPRTTPDGLALYALKVAVFGEDSADIIKVTVSGSQPKGLVMGAAVRLVELVATTWTMADRSGISYSCSAIEVLSAPATAKTASA